MKRFLGQTLTEHLLHNDLFPAPLISNTNRYAGRNVAADTAGQDNGR